jgi:antitoxin component YwqK of YwqJK toxin-antitoxin module
MKNGLKHGREITRTDDGQLLLIEPYVQGKVHGTAKQYGRNGNVIGTYTLVHGTGVDIWRQEEGDGTVFVSEIHSSQYGFPDGFEWGFASSKQDLWLERHWHRGKVHGIERVWNRTDKLRRGYPRFYIDDRPVSKQEYIEMTLTDKSLPVYREADNRPDREWPLDLKRLFSS